MAKQNDDFLIPRRPNIVWATSGTPGGFDVNTPVPFPPVQFPPVDNVEIIEGNYGGSPDNVEVIEGNYEPTRQRQSPTQQLAGFDIDTSRSRPSVAQGNDGFAVADSSPAVSLGGGFEPRQADYWLGDNRRDPMAPEIPDPLATTGLSAMQRDKMEAFDPVALAGVSAAERPQVEPRLAAVLGAVDIATGAAPGTNLANHLRLQKTAMDIQNLDKEDRMRQATALAWKAQDASSPDQKAQFGQAIKRLMPEFAGLDDNTAADMLVEKERRAAEAKERLEQMKATGKLDLERMKGLMGLQKEDIKGQYAQGREETKGDYSLQKTDMTNASRENIAGMNNQSREQIASANIDSREAIANANNSRAMAVAGEATRRAMGVAGLNAESRETIANANNNRATLVAGLNNESRETVAGMNNANRLATTGMNNQSREQIAAGRNTNNIVTAAMRGTGAGSALTTEGKKKIDEDNYARANWGASSETFTDLTSDLDEAIDLLKRYPNATGYRAGDMGTFMGPKEREAYGRINAIMTNAVPNHIKRLKDAGLGAKGMDSDAERKQNFPNAFQNVQAQSRIASIEKMKEQLTRERQIAQKRLFNNQQGQLSAQGQQPKRNAAERMSDWSNAL